MHFMFHVLNQTYVIQLINTCNEREFSLVCKMQAHTLWPFVIYSCLFLFCSSDAWESRIILLRYRENKRKKQQEERGTRHTPILETPLSLQLKHPHPHLKLRMPFDSFNSNTNRNEISSNYMSSPNVHSLIRFHIRYCWTNQTTRKYKYNTFLFHSFSSALGFAYNI